MLLEVQRFSFSKKKNKKKENTFCFFFEKEEEKTNVFLKMIDYTINYILNGTCLVLFWLNK